MVCAIAAGLHRQPDYGPDYKVTAASEYKRKVFSTIYYTSNNHAGKFNLYTKLMIAFLSIFFCKESMLSRLK